MSNLNQQHKLNNDKDDNSDDIVINSTFIQRATFNDGTLTVYFKSGLTLNYDSVDESTWQAFKTSSSKGSFYATKIKGKFDTGNIKKVPLVTDFTKPRETQWTKLMKTQRPKK